MKLLAAVDGSVESEEALDHCVWMAQAADASVTVAHSVDPDVFDRGGTEHITTASDADQKLIYESVEDAEQRGLRVLSDAEERCGDAGLDVDTEMLYGNPGERLTEYADDEGFDAIYVGHLGRSERAQPVMGSVARDVVERSPVPVTVVR